MEETIWRRRLAVLASVVAFAGFGVAAAGCGDDNGDSEDIENAADDAVQEGEEAAGDVGDAADEAIDDAGLKSRTPRRARRRGRGRDDDSESTTTEADGTATRPKPRLPSAAARSGGSSR